MTTENTQQMVFSLEQLAHFNRCLFPDNIAEKIGEAGGYTQEETLFMKLDFRHQIKTRPLDVVSMFQDRIKDERFCKALTLVLVSFCKKHWSNNQAREEASRIYSGDG